MRYFLALLMLFATNAYAGYKVTGNLEVTGNAGVGSSNPRAKLDVDGSVYATTYFGDGQYLTGVSTTETDPKVGTLAANQVPKWGTTALVDSQIYDNGTNVGIGTTNPSQKLDVVGNILASGTVTGSNLSGTNTGDNATNSQYSGLVTNATHTGDATGSGALTVVRINGVALSGLETGILKNTTSTGAPSIAIASDFPTLNQNTTGSAATLTTARTINGVSFNGSANIAVPSDITPGTSGNVLTSNGSVWTSAASSGGISGLSTNKVSKAGSATTLVDSIIYDNGTNVGIGSILPSARLNVVGSGTTTGMSLSVRNSALTSTFVVLDNGNVGIGSTNPRGKLEIVGTGDTYIGYTTGNVGIGTNVTSAKLTVSGDISVAGTGNSFTNYTSGNLGIGTNNPVVKLHVGLGSIGAGVSLGTTGSALIKQDLEVDGTIYVMGNIQVDSAIYGTGISRTGVTFNATTTCGCKTWVDGICIVLGSCS